MSDGEREQEELDLPIFDDGPEEGVELELDEDDLGGDLSDYLDEEEEEAMRKKSGNEERSRKEENVC